MYLSASELCSQSQWLITMVVNLYPNQSPICVIIMGYQDQSQQRSHHLVTVPSGASLGGGGRVDGTIQKGACVPLLTALLSDLGDPRRLEASDKRLLMSISYY